MTRKATQQYGGTAQYGRQELTIAAHDKGGIRQRVLYGLRLLNDARKIAEGGGLKHGVTDKLIAEAAKRGVAISAREIQWRLQAARAYPTEVQIRNAVSGFGAWRDLIQAGFPAYEAPPDEPPADYRTAEEVRHDHARQLADMIDLQGALFPPVFEPATTPLKELADYIDQQDKMTASFVETGKRRRAYFERLVEAADQDMSVTWQEAHDRLGTTEE